MPDAAALSLTLLAAAEARNFVTSACDTVGRAHSTADTADTTTGALRRGELAGLGLAVGFGAACSAVARSWWPLGAAVVVAAVTVGLHETEMRRATLADTPLAEVVPFPEQVPPLAPPGAGLMVDT